MITYLLVTGLTTAAYLYGWMDPEPAPVEDPPPPPASPREVMSVFLDEIASQSRRREAKMMREVLEEYAVVTGATWSAIDLPCYPSASAWRPRGADRRPTDGSPEESYWERVASVLADNYGVSYEVVPMGVVPIDKKRTYTMCAVVFYTTGTRPPHLAWEGANFQRAWAAVKAQARAQIGAALISPTQIVNLIVSTVIQAGVGTVTSLGMVGLVRSMGGERRLARLMRRYKRGGRERVKRKIIRTASRLKGRMVDWSEVERIMTVAAAPPPPPALPPPNPIPDPLLSRHRRQ